MPGQHTVQTPYMVGPVHCYTVECAGELVLFDTGPPTEVGKKYLKETINLKRLRHIIITHCHLDHYGLSSWLEKNSDAVVYLPNLDILKIQNQERRLRYMFEMLSSMGFADNFLRVLRESFNRAVLFPPFPERFLVAERDIPERLGLTVTSCAGHSQSDLVYSTDRWAITGDTLLRNIYQSPLLDIDLEHTRRFNNYQAYCRSLLNLAQLRGKIILPGHRQDIESVDATIIFYIKKTLQRIRFLKPYLDESSVARIIEQIFGEQMSDPFHVYLKASEIVFMRDLLQNPSILKTALKKIGLFSSVQGEYDRVLE